MQKKIDEIVEWLIDQYPPFLEIDKENLKNNIEKNIINGWIPYIKWYNETHEKKLNFPTSPKAFILEVFHCSLSKCEISPPKIGQGLYDYLIESYKEEK